jgi:hypothetical protein
MAWNTTTSLTSAAITAATLEQATLSLLAEYLGVYFSGGNHTLNTVSTYFPLVALAFQADKLPTQPLEGGAIQVVWEKPGRLKTFLERGKRRGHLKAKLTFYVMCAGQNTAVAGVSTGGPRVLAKKITDLLFALLSSKAATLALARKGCHHVKPQQATLVTVEQYVERTMTVNCELIFDL